MTNLSLNQIFIRYSSQTICGIKPANLFTVSAKELSRKILTTWENIASKQKLILRAFEISNKTMMIFIYNSKWIQDILSNSSIQNYMSSKKFSSPHNVEKSMEELIFRLKEKNEFPHEVGIFLGYPLEDVIKFEENKGKFCKYCGYWKSYSNPEEARKCCDLYRDCCQMCTQWFDEGYSIPQIIKKYKKAVKKAA